MPGSGLHAAKFLTVSCFCRDLKLAFSSAKEQNGVPSLKESTLSCLLGQINSVLVMLCQGMAGSGATCLSPVRMGSYTCAAVGGGEQLTFSC